MTENSKKGGICHSIYQYANAINKHIRDYDENKELVMSSILGCK